jgi:lactoylglutathione lyase
MDGSVLKNFRFIYTGIRVRNMEESLKFYTNVLHMKIVEELQKTEPTKGQVVTLKSEDSEQLLELNYYEENSRFGVEYKNGEELDHLAFDVEDLSGTVEQLRKQGVEIVAEPYSIGYSFGWKEAFVKDPNGIWIELLERKRG